MITWINAGVAVPAMGAATGLALAGQTAVAIAVAGIGVAAFGTASAIRITVIIRR
jgi:hypothetical protein